MWDLIRWQETVGLFFYMGGIFSAIWLFCRIDSENIFILLVLSSMSFFNPLVSWLPAPSPLCSLLGAARVTLVMVEARVSTVFPFMPYLPLLPSLGLTELVLMKEIIYLHFLFSAIDQNHSSLLLHAQLAGLGMFLHWAGLNKEDSLLAVLDKSEGCICSCHSSSLQSYELKPS